MPVIRVRIGAKRIFEAPYSIKQRKEEEADPFLSSDGDSWYRISRLGEGYFGSVYLAITQETHGLPYQIAVKSSLYTKSSTLRHEARVLWDLKNCTYVVKCYGEEVTTNRGGEQVHNMLLEYCSGLSLQHQIDDMGRIPEGIVRSYTRDVVRGLKYVHGYGYAHCDIKPANILLVPSTSSDHGFTAKIADFGLAKEIDEWDIKSGDKRGTLCYKSPELIKESRLDFPVDIWALGCTVMEMLCGEPTWDCSNPEELFRQIAHSDRVSDMLYMSDGISDVCKDFITKCLATNVGDRWTAKKLLKHPFLAAT